MLQPFGAGMRGWGCSVFSAHLLDESESGRRDLAVLGLTEGVAWDSPGGEGTVCPWAERGGDTGRRGGRRMRALRVRATMGRAGAPKPEALAPIRDSPNIPGSGDLEREPPSGLETPS